MSSNIFNENQLKAIRSRKNLVLSAGAGSGKTAVLSERFLSLIEEGSAHADEILTITFTRKATSEMKERIYSKLLSLKQTNPEKAAEEIKRFPFCSISTIDSFCSSVVRSDCVSYGFTSDFSVTDERDFKETVRKIANSFVEKNRNEDAFSKFIRKKSADSLIELFTELGVRVFTVAQPILPESAVNLLLGQAKKIFTDSKERLCAVWEELNESDGFTGGKYGQDSRKSLEVYIGNLKLLNFGEKPENVIISNPECLKLDKRGFSKELSEEVGKDAIYNLASLVNLSYSVSVSEDVFTNLYKLISEFEQEVAEKKRELNALTFNDITKMAIDILLHNKEIRKKYKKKFRYIMIDEFQDNNADCKNLLYLLSEKEGTESDEIPDRTALDENKIFLVGDEKQSIYAFRGADVSVFKSLNMEIGSSLELDVNYRSNSELVTFFNTFFNRIMGGASDEKSLFEADFKPLKYSEKKVGDEIKGRIIFNNCSITRDELKSAKNSDNSPEEGGEEDAEENANLVQSEAASVALLIKEMLETDNFLINDEKTGNPVRPKEKDIAILFGKGSHQNEYEKALKLKGIKYTVLEARGLTGEAVFNDFYSVLQIILYPEDTVSLFSYLKGPFCRFKDSEIPGCFECDVNGSNVYRYETLRDEHRKKIEVLKEKAALCSLTELLDYLFYDLGYREFLITNPANQVFIEHYDYLYTLATSFDKKKKGLSEFLDYLRPMLGNIAKLDSLNVIQEESQGVNIMTIHKSKGLGFPIVIVVDMGSTKERNTSDMELDESGVPFIRFSDMYDYGKSGSWKNCFVNPWQIFNKKIIEEKKIAERKRLLYVAATRAKYHLVFSAFMLLSKNDNEEKSGKSMLDMLLDATRFDFDAQCAVLDCVDENTGSPRQIKVEGRRFALIPENETFSKTRLTREMLEKNSFWYENRNDVSDKEQFDTRPGSASVTGLNRDSYGFSETGGNEKKKKGERLPEIDSDDIISRYGIYTEFGTLVHYCIENRINKSSDDSDFVNEKIAGEELETLKNDAEALADGFIKSSLFAKIKNYELFPEKEFFMYDESLELTVRGVMDLLAVSDKLAVIIDFKTDRFKNPDEYAEQLSYYKKAMRSMYPNKEVSAYLVYLRDAENYVSV